MSTPLPPHEMAWLDGPEDEDPDEPPDVFDFADAYLEALDLELPITDQVRDCAAEISDLEPPF